MHWTSGELRAERKEVLTGDVGGRVESSRCCSFRVRPSFYGPRWRAHVGKLRQEAELLQSLLMMLGFLVGFRVVIVARIQ